MQPTHAEAPDDRARLLAMINANWMTQAIGTAAALELPALLAEAPQRAEGLARACACHAPSLHRLLRALASLGVCSELDDGRFELTPLGALLRPDSRDSLYAWARLRSAQWPAWGQLEQSVKSGDGWRKRTLGIDDFSYLVADPQAAALFHRAMVELTRRIAAQLLRVIKFGDDERVVVDVGGGSGELLAALLLAHPALRGIVFDLEHARCALILRHCRAAMTPQARLLVIERIAPERLSDVLEHRSVAASDLNMLVALSGRERREAEFRAMLDEAGLRAKRIAPTGGDFHVIEAVAG